MRKFLHRKLALFMVLAILVPMIWNQNSLVAMAATPAFLENKVEIKGVGETYQLEIKNKVAKSKYTWTSGNTKIATVTKSGLVTSVNKGIASIRCKITYPSKKTKTLTCKVTVTIPASEISITNAPLLNGAFQLTLGSTYDFDTAMVPDNTTDKNYWFIDDELGSTDSIRIDDAEAGKITAVKAGKVALKVRAAKTSSLTDAEESIVDDAIIIEVIAPTATVKSADIVGSNQLVVVFDSPVQQSTVLNSDYTLSNNIQISMCKNVKGVLADDPGKLTGYLSSDMKTLTITSEKNFSGEYAITFTKNILTLDGIALEKSYNRMSFIDQIPPSVESITLDDTGLIATITFNETIDFTSFKVSNATVATAGVTADPTTIITLNNKSNYVIGVNKRSVTIDLSKIVATDFGKAFSIVISGIKDLAGNAPASSYLTAIIRTDNTQKPQAQYLYMTRTSYNTITATFDRAIQSGGMIQISGGVMIPGVVDAADKRKVNYNISDAEALYTGSKQVNIGYWNSYNVLTTDTSASKFYSYYLDFTVEKTSPYCTYSFDAVTSILTLTYNENVSIVAGAGTFSSTFTSVTDDIRPGTNLTYTIVPHTDGNNIIKLKLNNLSYIGNYTFTVDAGFVKDVFRNLSTSTVITISNATGETAELPPPYIISQSTSNSNEINLYFANKLDKASAETLSNYYIPGVTIIRAELISNASDGAVVKLTVADGSIDVSIGRPFTIKGVKGYNDSYTAISTYTANLELKENKKPTFISSTFDSTAKNGIKLNFSEQIQGKIDVKVTQSVNGYNIELPNTVTVTNNYAYITLATLPTNGTYLKIDVVSNTLTDLSGNSLGVLTSVPGVLATY